MPTFQSPVFTGLVADVLCMYTVLRVLLCYRIVLRCYRCSVTEVLNHSSGFRISVYQFENRMHRDALLLAIGYWVLSLPSLSQLGFARVYYRACACMCARVYSRVRACVCASRSTPKNQGGFRLMTGGARARELFTVVAPQICVRPN